MLEATRPTSGKGLRVTLSPCHLVTLSVVLAVGCDFPGRPGPADRPVPADKVTDFGVLYATRCAGCHGADGKLGPAPPLNDPIFLAIVPDAELLRVITEGRTVTPGQKSPMPAFAHDRGGPLTAAQVKVLAEGIKKHWQPPASPTSELPAYLAPAPAGARNKNEGARVFARACAGCHGPQGQGEKDGQPPGCWGDQQPGVPGSDERPGPAPHHHHRTARSRHAGLRRNGRPAAGFPRTDLGGDRPSGRAAEILAAGRFVPRQMTFSA